MNQLTSPKGKDSQTGGQNTRTQETAKNRGTQLITQGQDRRLRRYRNSPRRHTPSAASETREARGLGREPSRIVEEDGLPPET